MSTLASAIRAAEKPLAPEDDPELFDAALFDAQYVRAGAPLALFRNTLRHGDETLTQRYLAGVRATDLVRQRAWLIDQVLLRAWDHCHRSASVADLALVAVGGYGRAELHPGSDIDLLILTRSEDHEPIRSATEEFVRFLWDMGLEVAHSVRSRAQCVQDAECDITVATNLMEARHLAGPASLFQALRAALGPKRLWPSDRFFAAKWKEQLQRHRAYHDSGYYLEPNVKESPGGLRDIHMIGWVTMRHFAADTLHDLVGHGFLTEEEFASLMQGREFLWRLRFGLHVLAGRREDRLLFEHQAKLASQFGFHDADHTLAVEQLMQRYYRTVREISLLNEMLLQLFQEAILHPQPCGDIRVLSPRFQDRCGFIEARSQEVFRERPRALLEIFVLMAQHPEIQGIRATTLRLIRDHRELLNDRVRRDPATHRLFLKLLRQSQGVTRALRRMNRYGVLGTYLPAFGRIVGKMQHDLFHAYTVDEHILFVVGNLRRLWLEKEQADPVHLRASMRRIQRPEVLYLAALFHDIAKGRGGDHSQLGAMDAEAFCISHGLGAYYSRLVAWLVRHHLSMSMTAQREDISDPEVIQTFGSCVGDVLHLDHLYLLTVADMQATNPNLWNSWKAALLDELYGATLLALRRGLENPIDMSERIRDQKKEVLRLLRSDGPARDQIRALWRTMPEDYFLRHSADEIAWHTRAILSRPEPSTPLVLVRQLTHRGGTEIFLYTPDQDALFAATAAAIERLRLSVMEARIITSSYGYALDTYIVLEHDGNPIEDPARVAELVASIETELATPTMRIGPVQRHIPLPARHFRVHPKVEFSTDQVKRRTIVELTCSDRPGVLARVGEAFVECGVRLHNAKIATLGERVRDVFFITDHDNRPLTDSSTCARLLRTLLRNLE